MPSSLILAIFLISLSHILISDAALINIPKESELVKETAIVDLRSVHERPAKDLNHDCSCGRIRKRSFMWACWRCSPVLETGPPPIKVSTHWTDGEPTGPEQEAHEYQWRLEQAKKRQDAAQRLKLKEASQEPRGKQQQLKMSDPNGSLVSQYSEKSSKPLLKNQ